MGEVVEGGAAVFAAGGDGDADAGDLGVDFEFGLAADCEEGVSGVPYGGFCGEVIRPSLSWLSLFRGLS